MSAERVKLKPSTERLLERLRSRRESRITDRKNERGYWIFAHPRVRSVADYDRIASFPRGGKIARRIARGMVEKLVGEARRFEARHVGDRSMGGKDV